MEFKMNQLDLKKINSEIERFASDRDWDQFHSVKNLSMALSVESAELLEIFQWFTEEQSNKVKNDPKTMSKVEDEVADIFVYLLRIVSKTNIDLEAAVLNKLKKNAEKYPIEMSRGNSKKYNEF
jgi:NTP pyrophosphatase (non-canonical NTP hydrolase)